MPAIGRFAHLEVSSPNKVRRYSRCVLTASRVQLDILLHEALGHSTEGVARAFLVGRTFLLLELPRVNATRGEVR